MEKWKSIKGYEQFYQVSDLGRVRSLTRVINRKDGATETRHGRILTPAISANGYYHLNLCNDGATKTFFVHRLVAIHFVKNKYGKPQINHINGDKLDNRSINLEWVTHSENISHAYQNGLRALTKGEKHGASKLNDQQVLEIKALIANQETNKEIALKFGVSTYTINDIRRGRTWNHLTP